MNLNETEQDRPGGRDDDNSDDESKWSVLDDIASLSGEGATPEDERTSEPANDGARSQTQMTGDIAAEAGRQSTQEQANWALAGQHSGGEARDEDDEGAMKDDTNLIITTMNVTSINQSASSVNRDIVMGYGSRMMPPAPPQQWDHPRLEP